MKLDRTGLLTRKYNVRDPKLFIVATEGQNTEPEYLGMPVLIASGKVHVKVLPTLDGKSAPEHVFTRLKEFEDEYDFGPEDELWLVIDRDSWDIEALVEPVAEKGYFLAVSNPCFELWLILHFAEHDPSDTTCKQLKKKLRSHIGKHRDGAPNRARGSVDCA